MAKPRLFVENDLNIDDQIEIDGANHHYLSRVMRARVGESFEIFNGRSPSYNARIKNIEKRSLSALIVNEAAPFLKPSPLTLAFAPIKKQRTDFIVEKAAELGVHDIQPIYTDYTNSERIRIDRLQKHVIEAVEQCGGTFIPEVKPILNFNEFIELNEGELIFCDETTEVRNGRSEFDQTKFTKCTIIIGPEGGFSDKERALMINKNAIRLSLGPRILRADTAAVAAISIWQQQHGDWK